MVISGATRRGVSRMWAVKIEKAENGFIITPIDDEETTSHLAVEQLADDFVQLPDGKTLKDYDLSFEQKAKLEEQCSMADMLWFLREYFGGGNNKYDVSRLEIRIELNKDVVKETDTEINKLR